jgi:hypothetical protein
VPQRVAVAPDGTIWVAGIEILSTPPAGKSKSLLNLINPDGKIIRHLDALGNSLTSYIAQSTIHDVSSLMASSNLMGSSSKRIAWYSASEQRYVEIAGEVITDLPVLPLPVPGARASGIALTDDGRTFVSIVYGGPKRVAILMLDQSRSKWLTIDDRVLGDRIQLLYGAEGGSLVGALSNWRSIGFFTVTQN